MASFQIGRIKGRRKNFLPPIQGGRFRPYCVEVEQAAPLDDSTASDQGLTSESTSAPGSPLFDATERSSLSKRRDQGAAELRESSSVSSISSMLSLEPKKKPRPSHMDARTQEEIRLDLEKDPPLDPATQDDIVRRYRQVDQFIHAEGLYQCRYTDYMIELGRYALLFGLCLLFLWLRWYGVSGLFLGLFWHQLVFTAHDAGHVGITHNFVYDTVIGVAVTDFFGGLSIG